MSDDVNPEGGNAVHILRRFVAECEKEEVAPTRDLLLAAPNLYRALKTLTDSPIVSGMCVAIRDHARQANYNEGRDPYQQAEDILNWLEEN